MRILYVVNKFPTFSQTFVLQEVRTLIELGTDVAIWSLTPPTAEDLLQPGAAEMAKRTGVLPHGPARAPKLTASLVSALLTVPRTSWPKLWWSLRWTVRERDLRHVLAFLEYCFLRTRVGGTAHIHSHWAHRPTSVALMLAASGGRPFSFTGHAVDIFELVTPPLLAEKIRLAKFVVAVTEHGKQRLGELVNEKEREKIVVVRNGLDRTRFAPRERLPHVEPQVILAVSRLVEKKGLDTLIEACAKLVERGVDFRCRILGDGPVKEHLQDLVATLALQGRVALEGSRDHGTIREAYEQAAVFALPCRRMPGGDQDGLPVAITEALAIGVPVVSTPIAGIPEVVHDNRSGFLVPPDDADALADALERVLHDPALQEVLATGAMRAVTEFDAQESALRLRTLFTQGRAGL